MKTALIIFVRNPVLGKVKTRLAASIGEEKALQVYQQLLLHTRDITIDLPCDRFVFYADFINEADIWSAPEFNKRLQQGDDLGKRMQHAFEELFSAGFDKVAIIGSDCYQLTGDIIVDAFTTLQRADVVIGPAGDGGYYLLAMQQMIPEIFEEIPWSTPVVLSKTMAILQHRQYKTALLKELNDVDEEKDLYFLSSTPV